MCMGLPRMRESGEDPVAFQTGYGIVERNNKYNRNNKKEATCQRHKWKQQSGITGLLIESGSSTRASDRLGWLFIY